MLTSGNVIMLFVLVFGMVGAAGIEPATKWL